MALSGFAKKLVRTVARVIPQCGMVSQAVAFNMFLVFFPSLLFALGLMSRFLNSKSGQDFAARLAAILPPGGGQLISDYILRREVNPWTWVVLGWLGSLLVGLQVMKLIMEGIRASSTTRTTNILFLPASFVGCSYFLSPSLPGSGRSR